MFDFLLRNSEDKTNYMEIQTRQHRLRLFRRYPVILIAEKTLLQIKQ